MFDRRPNAMGGKIPDGTQRRQCRSENGRFPDVFVNAKGKGRTA